MHMGKAGFYIRRLARFSGSVEADVPVLRENPTADHPVLARPLTGRLLCRVFKHHDAGPKGSLTFIHVLPCSLPLYDMGVSIDHRHRLTPSFLRIYQPTVRAARPVLSRGTAAVDCNDHTLDSVWLQWMAPVVPGHDFVLGSIGVFF